MSWFDRGAERPPSTFSQLEDALSSDWSALRSLGAIGQIRTFGEAVDGYVLALKQLEEGKQKDAQEERTERRQRQNEYVDQERRRQGRGRVRDDFPGYHESIETGYVVQARQAIEAAYSALEARLQGEEALWARVNQVLNTYRSQCNAN